MVTVWGPLVLPTRVRTKIESRRGGTLHLDHALIAGIRDEDVPRWIHRHGLGTGQSGPDCGGGAPLAGTSSTRWFRSTMKRVPAASTATEVGKFSPPETWVWAPERRNFHHAVVIVIGDVDIARSIHRDAVRESQSAAHSDARPVGGGNFDHAVVAVIGDEDVARSINRYALRKTQAVCHRGLFAAMGEFHHTVVAGIGDEDVARSIHRYAHWGNAVRCPRRSGRRPGATLSTRWFEKSAMYTLPAPSTETPLGLFSPLATVIWAPGPNAMAGPWPWPCTMVVASTLPVESVNSHPAHTFPGRLGRERHIHVAGCAAVMLPVQVLPASLKSEFDPPWVTTAGDPSYRRYRCGSSE